MFLFDIMDYIFTIAVIGILFLACYIGFYKSFLPNLFKLIFALIILAIPVGVCVMLIEVGNGSLLGLDFSLVDKFDSIVKDLPLIGGDDGILGKGFEALLIDKEIIGMELGLGDLKLEGNMLVLVGAAGIPLMIFVVWPILRLIGGFVLVLVGNIFTPVLGYKPIRAIDRILCVFFYFVIGLVFVAIAGVVLNKLGLGMNDDKVIVDPAMKALKSIFEAIGVKDLIK